MTYKTETHLHTAESSFCASIYALDMLHAYKEEGYSTIIITDHYLEHYFKHVSDNWSERLDYLMNGYKEALKHAKELGINVLFGIELKLRQTSTDYLIYGITEEFLRNNLNLYKLSLEELIDICNKNNYLIVNTHPFRKGMELIPLEYKVPIEIYNGNSLQMKNNRNHLAEGYALKHNLIGISGSDFHNFNDLANGGIVTNYEINSIEDFINCVKNNDFKNIINKQVK